MVAGCSDTVSIEVASNLICMHLKSGVDNGGTPIFVVLHNPQEGGLQTAFKSCRKQTKGSEAGVIGGLKPRTSSKVLL